MSGFWMLVRCFVYPSSPKIMVQWNMPFFCKGNGLCGWTHSMDQSGFPNGMSRIHPGRLAWNIPITHLERKMIFQTSMIMFQPLIFQGVAFLHSWSKGVERPSWKANFASALKHLKMIIVEVSLDGIIPVVCGRRFPSKRMPTRRDLKKNNTPTKTRHGTSWKLMDESWLFERWRRIMEMGGNYLKLICKEQEMIWIYH